MVMGPCGMTSHLYWNFVADWRLKLRFLVWNWWTKQVSWATLSLPLKNLKIQQFLIKHYLRKAEKQHNTAHCHMHEFPDWRQTDRRVGHGSDSRPRDARCVRSAKLEQGLPYVNSQSVGKPWSESISRSVSHLRCWALMKMFALAMTVNMSCGCGSRNLSVWWFLVPIQNSMC